MSEFKVVEHLVQDSYWQELDNKLAALNINMSAHDILRLNPELNLDQAIITHRKDFESNRAETIHNLGIYPLFEDDISKNKFLYRKFRDFELSLKRFFQNKDHIIWSGCDGEINIRYSYTSVEVSDSFYVFTLQHPLSVQYFRDYFHVNKSYPVCIFKCISKKEPDPKTNIGYLYAKLDHIALYRFNVDINAFEIIDNEELFYIYVNNRLKITDKSLNIDKLSRMTLGFCINKFILKDTSYDSNILTGIVSFLLKNEPSDYYKIKKLLSDKWDSFLSEHNICQWSESDYALNEKSFVTYRTSKHVNSLIHVNNNPFDLGKMPIKYKLYEKCAEDIVLDYFSLIDKGYIAFDLEQNKFVFKRKNFINKIKISLANI